MINATKGTLLGVEVGLALTHWRRLVGLLGRESLKEEGGLLLAPCRSIHTFFMRFPIDVLFLDKDGRVTEFVCNMAPYKVKNGPKGTRQVLELPAGTIKCTGTTAGDCIIFT